MLSLQLKQWIASVLQFNINNIYVGFYNGIVVPKTEPYIMIQPQGSSKIQTPYYSTSNDIVTELMASKYQIDFYRTEDLSNQFYLIISSYGYPDWGNFIEFSTPKNLFYVNSTDRYIERYSVDITISHYITTNIVQERFNNIIIQTILVP